MGWETDLEAEVVWFETPALPCTRQVTLDIGFALSVFTSCLIDLQIESAPQGCAGLG